MTDQPTFEVSHLRMTKDEYGRDAVHIGWKKPGLVRIRPCAAEYEGKTYLGVYVGDVALGFSSKYHPEEKTLELGFSQFNPAIFVPALGKIIYGIESWWGQIRDEEDLKDISDNDINNVWYVKMLKSMMERDAAEASDETV